MAAKADEYVRGMVTGGTLFEELGFFYLGPIDGHNIDHLLPVLRNLEKSKWDGPVFLHVVTKKGYGFHWAMAIFVEHRQSIEVLTSRQPVFKQWVEQNQY